MNYAQLLEDVKSEVVRFFHLHEDDGLSYHNQAHTESVVAKASMLASHYHLDDRDFFVVATAAWFHDIGYFTGEAAGHEARGAEMAASFLRGKRVEEETINAIENCVLATRMPQSPQNLLEQIVCDADLYHLGTDSFLEQNKQMRKEAAWRTGKKISKGDWRKNTISLLAAHHYHTDYGRQLLEEKKDQNLEILRQKDAETGEPVLEQIAHSSQPAAKAEPDGVTPPKKQKNDRPDRGIDTMFRISSGNHQRLSDMADNKAHIMISTTSIIISVLLSVLLRKLEDNQHLILPTTLLLAVCVITMVFSILATRPSLPDGRFTQQDIDQRKVNLLFFGNFYRMSLDDYAQGVQKMMTDRDFLYGSLTKDVYSQGVVLGRKYRYLRVAYNVFMFGIVISVLSFVIASVFFGH